MILGNLRTNPLGSKGTVLASAVGLVAMVLSFSIARADPCTPETVGVDTSQWRRLFIAAVLGRAVGETFTTSDTLIRSMTVWRWPGEDSTVVRMKLWVTGAYEDGFPNLYNIILSGPALMVFGDGVHPVKIQYAFDPPLALPRPGKYAFFIQPECVFLYFDLLRVDTDDYPGGRALITGRSRSCSLGPAGYAEFPEDDLVFDIEFCRTDLTPVRRRTWGGLKLIYR